MRLIQTNYSSTKKEKMAKVYRDTELQEYVVKFYNNNVYQKNADYFTPDKDDAVSTATRFCNQEA